MSANPFAAESYDLGTLILTTLEEGRARVAARFIAASEPWASLAYTNAGLERYLTAHDPALRRFAAFLDGALVGVVCVRYPWLRGPYLELIAFREEHRGRGLGKRAMEWFEGEARGCSNAWVIVSDINPDAMRFYKRQGYAEVGRLPGLTAPGRTEILLRKTLG